MARPKSWFAANEYNTAKKAARTRNQGLWKYTRNTRRGPAEVGYYVGTALPARLGHATTERKSI